MSFDRTVPPGGEGKVTLRLDTAGFKGRIHRIHKIARVYTNTPGSRSENLSLKGTVRTSIRVSNTSVILRGSAGQEVSKTVTIRAARDRPLILEPDHFDLQERVRYRIREIEAGRVFQVRFTSIPGHAEDYFGRLLLKTNYPERPEIAFQIRGRFRN